MLLIFRVFDHGSDYFFIFLESVNVLQKTAAKQCEVKSACFLNQSLLKPDIHISRKDISQYDTNWIWMSLLF